MPMKKTTDHIRDHMFEGILAGYYISNHSIPGPERLTREQWSADFERKMRAEYRRLIGPPPIAFNEDFVKGMKNRLLQGAFRYTLMRVQRRTKVDYDHFAEIPKRLRLYLETGNGEFLLDVANFCLTTLEVGWWPPRSRDLPPTIGRRIRMVKFWEERWCTGARRALNLAGKMYDHMAEDRPISAADLYSIAALCAYEWTLCGHPRWKFESANESTGTHMGSA